MKVERTPSTISFGWTLNKKQAELIKSLPKQELDVFESKMMNAPMERTKEASKARDRILRDAINLAKKLKKKVERNDDITIEKQTV